MFHLLLWFFLGPLTCQILTLGMNPVVATATLHHLAVVVIIIIAFITQWAEVS